MGIREDIRPVTYLKSRTADVLDQVNETYRPIVITQNGESKAVIQDPDSFEATKRAIDMLTRLLQGEQDIRAGRLTPQDEVFARQRRKLKMRGRKRAETKHVQCLEVSNNDSAQFSELDGRADGRGGGIDSSPGAGRG